MKFFLDTANIEEIRKGVSLGLVDGVTTNPSLVAKEGKSLEDVAKEICDLVDGPVSLEVVSTESKDIIEEARRLAKVHENAVVKIPMIEEGLKALKVVSQEGIRVNVTLVFSLERYRAVINAFMLGLEKAHSEGIDISNFQGSDSVGSLVCFIDGQAKRSQYRYFKIRDLDQPDDYASIHQVVHRRFRGLQERDEAFPDLLLIDGGKGRLLVRQGHISTSHPHRG